MPFVRRHVTRRLKAAKAECDKELQRVTNNITAFFEDRLRERLDPADRDSQQGDVEHAFVDESSSDGGYDAELEFTNSSHHSRQRMFTLISTYFIQWCSLASSTSTSPGLRKQQAAPWDRPLSSSVSSSVISSSPAHSTTVLPEIPLTRKSSTQNSAWANQGISSRRLSRTIHIGTRSTRSGQSSRSTSRSRSPLPPLQPHASFAEYSATSPPPANRRSSRILVDDPVDPIMSALYEIISVATDITDMSVTQLTSQPKVCANLVQRVQNIGKAWDEHPDWHGRNWYVQVLLAVASLSRVVEWWEAEKAFWNFDDNDNDELDEPLTFVMKPSDEEAVPPIPTPTTKPPDGSSPQPQLDEESRLKLTRPPSQPRKSRDEHPKDLSASSPPKDAHSRATSKMHQHNDSARVLATERLRLQAETAQNQNVVMDLNLDGETISWINYAWRGVVGYVDLLLVFAFNSLSSSSEPDALRDCPISPLLYPPDSHVFHEATQRLLEDDSHTVEARFRLRVQPEDRDPPPGQSLYREMEGKGMLMFDRETGQATHTMWVVKPLTPARYESDVPTSSSLSVEDSNVPATADSVPATGRWVEPETPFPFNQPICTDPILCQICECHIPQWYFEKHSETCVETHRLEAEITECNESIAELRNTIKNIYAAVDRSSPGPAPEYRGLPIFTPSTSPLLSSPLQLFRANKMQRMGVKKMQKRLLDQLEDILQVASEVSVPALKEEEAKEPIERQRLLSPSSERKVTQIRNWSKPQTEDTTLGQLVLDAERVMRQKVDTVVRMQNTIRYSEKIWHEWEEKVAAYLATTEDSDSEEEQHTGDAQDTHEASDDHSSTTSEYAFNGDGQSDPTPMAPSPVPSATPSDARPATVTYPSRQPLQTRSSTPSSISSPLALAAPIVATSYLEHIPVMSLDEGASPVQSSASTSTPSLTLETVKSSQGLLEPKFVVTPPASPMVVPRDSNTSKQRSHRRHSTINPVTGPLSPRQSSVAPLSRSAATSIKDFEIIKPISKGAFGSVFLAKKKATGAYYAIKVLKKADMIAKNQITNVKAERMILMKQSDSPFVAKLYYTFQSKDNLYLVMEYLNGGDCAALIKSLGSLPEEWTKNYIAEVVLGLEYLHQRGVVHRYGVMFPASYALILP